jgi:hypothetical protein
MTDLIELRNRRRRLDAIDGDRAPTGTSNAWRDLAYDAIAAAERAADQAATLLAEPPPLPVSPQFAGRWADRKSVDDPWRYSDTGEIVPDQDLLDRRVVETEPNDPDGTERRRVV